MTTAAGSFRLLASLLCSGACLLGSFLPAASAAESDLADPAVRLAQASPPSQGNRVARPSRVPQACTRLKGVERRICVECDGVQVFKRIGCQQRVFWSACKGKRLFEDPYCQAHQDQGPPRGEGG